MPAKCVARQTVVVRLFEPAAIVCDDAKYFATELTMLNSDGRLHSAEMAAGKPLDQAFHFQDRQRLQHT